MGFFGKKSSVIPVPIFVGTHQLDALSLDKLQWLKIQDIRITVTFTGWRLEAYRTQQIERAALIRSRGLRPLIVVHSESEVLDRAECLKSFREIVAIFGTDRYYQIMNENDVENTGFGYLTPLSYSYLYNECAKIAPLVVPIAMGGNLDSDWYKVFTISSSPKLYAKNLYGEPLDQGLKRVYLSRPKQLPLWITETGSAQDQQYTIDLIEFNDRFHYAERIYLYQLIDYAGDYGLFSTTGAPTKLANYLHRRVT